MIKMIDFLVFKYFVLNNIIKTKFENFILYNCLNIFRLVNSEVSHFLFV